MNPQIKHAHAHANASARARLPLRVLRAARCGTSRLGVAKDRIELVSNSHARAWGDRTRWDTVAAAQRHTRQWSGPAWHAPIAWSSVHHGRIAMGGCDLCAFKEKPKVGAGINGTKEHRRSVGSRLLIWERCGRDAMRRARGRTARSKSGAWFFGTDNRAPRWVLRCGGRCMEPVQSHLPGGLLAREFVAGDGRSTLTTSAKV